MLPFAELQLETPDRLDQLVDLAAAPDAKLLAGGTDLLPSMKHRLFEPRTLVSLGGVEELRQIQLVGDQLEIGATATLREVRSHPIVRDRYAALADACGTIATSTIQAMGTLGGNVMLDTRCLFYNQPDGWREALGGCLKAEGHICHVAPKGNGCYAAQSSDTVPVLWLYGAELELTSTKGTRRIALARLFGREDGRDWLHLERGEVLTKVILPEPNPMPVVHHKVRARNAIDYGLLLLALQKHGRGGRAVVSAVGPSPIYVETDLIGDLPEAIYKAARPLATHVWSSTWRKHMARVTAARAIDSL